MTDREWLARTIIQIKYSSYGAADDVFGGSDGSQILTAIKNEFLEIADGLILEGVKLPERGE